MSHGLANVNNLIIVAIYVSFFILCCHAPKMSMEHVVLGVGRRLLPAELLA